MPTELYDEWKERQAREARTATPSSDRYYEWLSKESDLTDHEQWQITLWRERTAPAAERFSSIEQEALLNLEDDLALLEGQAREVRRAIARILAKGGVAG